MLKSKAFTSPSLVVLFRNFNHAIDRPELMDLDQLEACLLDQILELGRCSLNTVNASHKTKITRRLESTKVSIVCWKRVRCRRELVTAVGGVHDLLAK
jgi:hypothetical protein